MNAQLTPGVYTLATLSFLLSVLGLGVLLPIAVDMDNILWAIPVSFLLGLPATVMGHLARKQSEGTSGARTNVRMATFGKAVGLLESIVSAILILVFCGFFFFVCYFGVGC